MDKNKTSIYSLDEIARAEVLITLKEVYLALEDRGYNPINQLVGYLMSGDSGYISSHKDARKKINSLEREEILEVLIKEALVKK